MKTILVIFPLFMMVNCVIPDRFITGVYLSGRGDTLRLKSDRSFKAELMKPLDLAQDTTDTLAVKQKKFSSGRWHTVGRNLYLTVASKSMGDYWQCVPMKVKLSRLKRPVECGPDGKTLRFSKVRARDPKETKIKKEKKEMPE